MSDLAGSFRTALESGNLSLALGLVFVSGIATSLTPCVYPMIAITVSIFGARESQTRSRAALLSTSFVLGIATLFTPLGLLAATGGIFFGSLLSHPLVLFGLALFFLILAASMFGAFDIDLPPFLKTRLAAVGGFGVKGAFFLGLVSGIIAAPCTGPVLGFLLTWVGTTGDVLFGGLSLFVYALGLGLLFWVVGTFSLSLPKSGQWLEWFKSLFGIVMVVAALYYIRDFFPGLMEMAGDTMVFLSAALSCVVIGIALGAIHLSFHDTSTIRRIRKAMGITVMVAGILGLIGYVEALPEGARIQWQGDYHSAQKLALTSGRPLLVDFTASWCTACLELEKQTLSDPRIVRQAQRFVAVRVDLSPGQDSEEKQKILANYNQRGLPLLVLHKSTGTEAVRITEFMDADQFIKIIRSVR